MTRISIVFVATACLVSSLDGAENLQSLTEKYRQASGKVFGNPDQRKKKVQEHVAPLLKKIAKINSDQSLAFLVGEFRKGRPEVAAACVEHILTSSNARVVALLLEDFGRRPPVVQQSVLAALAKTKKDLKPAESQLLGLSRLQLRPELKALLPAVLRRFDNVDAARALFSQLRAPGAKGGDAEQKYRQGVLDALGKTKNTAVKSWIAGDAFAVAGSDAARLEVLARLVADLRLVGAREQLVGLISHASPSVGAAAIFALTKIGVGDASQEIARGLDRRRGPRSLKFRIQAMDALAASGSHGALDVVLRFARGRDSEMRLVAMGSLALVPKSQPAFEALLQGLSDDDPKVKAVALRALYRMRKKEMIGPLIDSLDEKNEYGHRVKALELLVSLTGENMGLVEGDWRKWWEVAEPRFELAKKAKKEFTSVKTYDLEYFGIGVSSKRLSFLVDRSSSMNQQVPVNRPVKGTGKGGTRPAGREGGDGEAKKRDAKAKGRGKTARKIDILKEELTRVIKKLSSDAAVNIVTFDKEIQAWQKQLQPMKGSGRARAVRHVRSIKTGQGTNVFDTVEFALKDKRVDTIYLLTDGVPSWGRVREPNAILREVDKLNRLRAVTIHCIAFGEQSEFLKKLAAQNGGKYRFVNRF